MNEDVTRILGLGIGPPYPTGISSVSHNSISTNVSATGNAAIFMPDDAIAQSGVGEQITSAALKMVIDVGSEQPDPLLLGYLVEVRGFINKPAIGYAKLIADLGGTTHTVDFPYGAALKEDYNRKLFSAPILFEDRALPFVMEFLLTTSSLGSQASVILTLDNILLTLIRRSGTDALPAKSKQLSIEERLARRKGV